MKQQTAIIYCRVSTEEQRDSGTSLQTQEQACRVYAESQGWKVARVFSEDFSGFSLNERPLFSEAREQVRHGKADILLCYAADRLTRNQTHAHIIFDEVCDSGAQLWFVRHGQVEDSTMGRAMLGLYATGAALERDNIIERTLRGKRARVMSGKVYNYGCELYGYRRDKQKGIREIYEPEAEVIRIIFIEYVKARGGLLALAR